MREFNVGTAVLWAQRKAASTGLNHSVFERTLKDGAKDYVVRKTIKSDGKPYQPEGTDRILVSCGSSPLTGPEMFCHYNFGDIKTDAQWLHYYQNVMPQVLRCEN